MPFHSALATLEPQDCRCRRSWGGRYPAGQRASCSLTCSQCLSTVVSEDDPTKDSEQSYVLV